MSRVTMTATDGSLARRSRRHVFKRRNDQPAQPAVPAPIHDEIQRELHRSRRTGRPFCLVRISTRAGIDPPLDTAEIRGFLRVIDRSWSGGSFIWLLLPETADDAARGLLARVRRLSPHILAGRAVGLAAFPNSALTYEGLLEAVAEWRPVAALADGPPPDASVPAITPPAAPPLADVTPLARRAST